MNWFPLGGNSTPLSALSGKYQLFKGGGEQHPFFNHFLFLQKGLDPFREYFASLLRFGLKRLIIS